ncbi:MAG: glycosyltransferase family 9 protein [Desulfovibrionaceae bacterium]|jgi:ADP-heptose:LPS heptosyltransferase|nr:glycosyltransferase family 9 protein [Desulfovibrionaceae bacterium]
MTQPITPPPGGFRKILVCQLRQIGDVLLATPAVRLLAAAYPRAELHVLTEKKCASMLEHNPDVARVWAIDRKELSNLFKEVAFYRRVAAEGFDLVVDFQQLPRCRWVVFFSHAPVRLSYTPPWYNRWLYTHTVDPLGGYAAMTKASVLRPLGLEWKGERPRLTLTDAERARAGEYLAGLGVGPEHRLVTVDPSHRRVTRRWPADHFARLLSLAAAGDASLRFLMLWGPGERELAEAVRAGMDEAARAACVVPEEMLGLREMAACVAAAALHLGNCSAPRHVAVAVDTPSVTIQGATSSAWTYPASEHADVAADLDCRPCNRNDCPHLRCLLELTPEAVYAVFREHLERFGR